MAKYNTRVELHNLPGGQKDRELYEKLHEEMERAEFERTIVGSSGGEYHLPHAEYQKETADTHDQIFEQAKAIANSVHKSNGVITWLYTSAKWKGLKGV